MSTQSILTKNKHTLLSDFEEALLRQADAVYTHNKFLVGEGVDRDRIQHTMNFHRLLCTDNCELSHYIQNKIAGNLNCKGDTISDTINNCNKCCPDYLNIMVAQDW